MSSGEKKGALEMLVVMIIKKTQKKTKKTTTSCYDYESKKTTRGVL